MKRRGFLGGLLALVAGRAAVKMLPAATAPLPAPDWLAGESYRQFANQLQFVHRVSKGYGDTITIRGQYSAETARVIGRGRP